MLAPNAQIVKSALDPLHFDLRILAGLGLLPVVVLGLLEPKDADAQAARVRDGWSRTPCPARSCARPPDGAARRRDRRRDPRHRRARRDPAGVAGGDRRSSTHRGALRDAGVAGRGARDAQAGVPQPAAGPGAERRADPARWSAWRPTRSACSRPGVLPRGQAMLLRQVKQLVESVPQRLSVTVVNPLQLLRELFTVNGAGTLIRRGSRIDVHDDAGTASIARASRRCSRRRSSGRARRLLRAAAGADLRRGELLGRGGRAGHARSRPT